MNTILLESTSSAIGECLHVERNEITFHNVTPERVAIEITVWNRGDQRSEPTHALLQAAPLGAFARWRSLVTVPVPALEPGEPYVLRTQGRRTTPMLLGKPERVSPTQLLTALDAEDSLPTPRAMLRERMRSRHPMVPATSTSPGTLPADLFGLLGHANPHWAGNLNVFVGRRAVERHLAQALRIYPGRTNLAMFVVGDGPDAYAFHLAGEGTRWDARLYDLTSRNTLALNVDDCPAIAEDRWIVVSSRRMMMLALQPPQACKRGTVEVHVEQRSTGQTAIVEFSLDPAAAGAGCYVVG